MLTAWTSEANVKTAMPLLEQVVASFKVKEGPPVVVKMIPIPKAEEQAMAALAEQLGVDQKTIKPESTFKSLGLEPVEIAEAIKGVAATFDLTMDEKATTTIKTAGSLATYIKTHAKQAEDKPEVPSHFPKNCLLGPKFSGGEGKPFSAGSSFLCDIGTSNERKVVLMTCQHLFGASGGLEKEIPWDEMRKQYPKVNGLLKSSRESAAEGTVLQIPGAEGLDDETSGLDLAVFEVSKFVKVDVLKLATANPKVGDRVFLNSPYVGWTAAKVVHVKEDQLTYTYYSKKVMLSGTSGAPVVNLAGEVVALNLGGGEQPGVTIGIGNPCERIRQLLTKAGK